MEYVQKTVKQLKAIKERILDCKGSIAVDHKIGGECLEALNQLIYFLPLYTKSQKEFQKSLEQADKEI